MALSAVTTIWGRFGAWLWVLLCEAGIAFTIVLFFYVVPEGTPKATYWGITIGGTALSIVVGFLLYDPKAQREVRAPAEGAPLEPASEPETP